MLKRFTFLHLSTFEYAVVTRNYCVSIIHRILDVRCSIEYTKFVIDWDKYSSYFLKYCNICLKYVETSNFKQVKLFEHCAVSKRICYIYTRFLSFVVLKNGNFLTKLLTSYFSSNSSISFSLFSKPPKFHNFLGLPRMSSVKYFF